MRQPEVTATGFESGRYRFDVASSTCTVVYRLLQVQILREFMHLVGVHVTRSQHTTGQVSSTVGRVELKEISIVKCCIMLCTVV